MLTQATVSPNPSSMDTQAALLCLLASPQLKDKENGCVAPKPISQQAQSCFTHCLAAMEHRTP